MLQEQLEQLEELEQDASDEQDDSMDPVAADGKRAKGTCVRAATAGGINFMGVGEASRLVFLGQTQQVKSW